MSTPKASQTWKPCTVDLYCSSPGLSETLMTVERDLVTTGPTLDRVPQWDDYVDGWRSHRSYRKSILSSNRSSRTGMETPPFEQMWVSWTTIVSVLILGSEIWHVPSVSSSETGRPRQNPELTFWEVGECRGECYGKGLLGQEEAKSTGLYRQDYLTTTYLQTLSRRYLLDPANRTIERKVGLTTLSKFYWWRF